ncbi:hypothetical protein QFZ49_007608 [Streptomyces turgidiscabies]|uniref:Uncharacterized protein n=1 Tax=Streptomyces turgidiscabies TaxID=85558 RepID=A0ABU0S0X1_9ACTN|nr:hypothetical protein [Streptomyces turgidiscabies]
MASPRATLRTERRPFPGQPGRPRRLTASVTSPGLRPRGAGGRSSGRRVRCGRSAATRTPCARDSGPAGRARPRSTACGTANGPWLSRTSCARTGRIRGDASVSIKDADVRTHEKALEEEGAVGSSRVARNAGAGGGGRHRSGIVSGREIGLVVVLGLVPDVSRCGCDDVPLLCGPFTRLLVDRRCVGVPLARVSGLRLCRSTRTQLTGSMPCAAWRGARGCPVPPPSDPSRGTSLARRRRCACRSSRRCSTSTRRRVQGQARSPR